MELIRIIKDLHPVNNEKLLDRAAELAPVLHHKTVEAEKCFVMDGQDCRERENLALGEAYQSSLWRGQSLCFEIGRHLVGCSEGLNTPKAGPTGPAFAIMQTICDDLLGCDCLDLTQHTLGQSFYRHAAAGRFGNKIFLIHGIELGKVSHISQETGCFEHLLKGHAGGLQDSADIFAALLRLGSDAIRYLTIIWIYRDLTRGENQAVDLITLGIGSNSGRGFSSVDNVHDNSSL